MSEHELIITESAPTVEIIRNQVMTWGQSEPALLPFCLFCFTFV